MSYLITKIEKSRQRYTNINVISYTGNEGVNISFNKIYIVRLICDNI